MKASQHGTTIVSRIFNYLSWSFLFAVIYAQSPLYTSNQNQYFLHGLAHAGYGYLQGDWLANTLDPTPVFSALVQYTYQIFQSEWSYYVYYAILMGIYFFSLVGIGDLLYGIKEDRKKALAYFALFLLFHSAALRFAFSTFLGASWPFVLEGGVANQRVLGAVFQPSTFGVFLIASIYLFLSNRIWPALLLIAFTTAFHPTYLLSAAMLTSSYMLLHYLDTASIRRPIAIGLLSLSLVSPIVIYVYASFATTPAEIARQANEILVSFRIPHHAIVADWFDWTTVLQISLVAIALYLMRRSRLFTIMLTCAGLAVGLTGLQLLNGSLTLALLFPWRISVILIPIAAATIAAWLVNALFSSFTKENKSFEKVSLILSFSTITILIVIGAMRFTLELEQQKAAPERVLYEEIEAIKTSSDVYLTPIKLQDFRLATGAPVYVDFKSIPYRAEEVLEWYRRIQQATEFYEHTPVDCASMQRIAAAEGITGIIVPAELHALACENFSLLAQSELYRTYKLIDH